MVRIILTEEQMDIILYPGSAMQLLINGKIPSYIALAITALLKSVRIILVMRLMQNIAQAELQLTQARELEPAAVELSPIQVEAPPLQQLLANITTTAMKELIKPIFILVALLNVHRDAQVNPEIIMAAAQLILQALQTFIITQLAID
jgi:hypothetical protein